MGFSLFFIQVNWFVAEVFKEFTKIFDGDNGITKALEAPQQLIEQLSQNIEQTGEELIENFSFPNWSDLSSNLSPIRTTLTNWKIGLSEKLENLVSNPDTINNLSEKFSNFQQSFSEWRTHTLEDLSPLLSNLQDRGNHLLTDFLTFLEPKLEQLKQISHDFGAKLEQIGQSSSQYIIDNFGNPANWNGETFSRAIENFFSSVTKSIFFLVEESLKGIWHGISTSVHDIWGILALLVIGFFILLFVRWQFVR